MPLNRNDETIPSEADKITDILGFKEIGGIGQLIYHPFRFRIDEINIIWMHIICTPFHDKLCILNFIIKAVYLHCQIAKAGKQSLSGKKW